MPALHVVVEDQLVGQVEVPHAKRGTKAWDEEAARCGMLCIPDCLRAYRSPWKQRQPTLLFLVKHIAKTLRGTGDRDEDLESQIIKEAVTHYGLGILNGTENQGYQWPPDVRGEQ